MTTIYNKKAKESSKVQDKIKKLRIAELLKDAGGHEGIKLLRTVFTGWIKEMNHKLLYDAEMGDEERKVTMRLREYMQAFEAIFPQAENNIEKLSKQVEKYE